MLGEYDQCIGHYPANESDFQAAVARLDRQSPSMQAGSNLPYKLVFVGHGSHAELSQPPPQEPGTIVCVFSLDLRQSWITATVLEKPVGGRVIWLELFGKPVVHGGYLSDSWYRPPQAVNNPSPTERVRISQSLRRRGASGVRV